MNDEKLSTDDVIVKVAKAWNSPVFHQRQATTEEAKRYKCASDLCETKIAPRD